MANKGLLDFTPDSSLVPRSYVVAKVEDTTVDESSKGKKRFGADCVIREPKALAGRHVYPRFIAGTENDPAAKEVETWKTGGFCRSIKQMVRAAEAESSDPDEAWMEMQGKLVGIFIGKRPNYLTNEEENSFSFFKPGARDPEVLEDAVAKAPVKPKPQKPSKDTFDEDGEFELVTED